MITIKEFIDNRQVDFFNKIIESIYGDKYIIGESDSISNLLKVSIKDILIKIKTHYDVKNELLNSDWYREINNSNNTLDDSILKDIMAILGMQEIQRRVGLL